MTINGAIHYPLATLYVGDLDSNITEAHLFEKFSSAGPVVSIRVCRDQITKHSLGYAYVNFQQQADAERALDTMNFDTINGRPMRIMWSQRDPALRKSGVGNVFIKNLDKSIDNKALYDTFSTFGNILSCKIMIDEHGNSKGYGFVHFETQEAADKAIQNVNNMLLNNKKVFVGEFVAKTDRSSSESQRKYTNVFIKNFGTELDDQQLRELFEKYGEVTSAAVAKNEDGSTKGYGFVNFKESHAAAEAVNALNDSELNGNKLFVGPFQKKHERVADLRKKHEEEKKKAQSAKQYAGVNLYVKNLDDNFDDERLRKEFSTFGELSSVRVMTDNGRSKGFGFVCFVNAEEATKALNDMNGRIIGSKPLFVAVAQRKEERKVQLANQYMQRMINIRLPHHHHASIMAQTAAAPHMYPSMVPPHMASMHQPRFAAMMQQQQRGRQMYPTSMSLQQQRNPQQMQRPPLARPRIGYYQQQQQQHQQQLRQQQQQPMQQQQQQIPQYQSKQQDQLTIQLLAEAAPQEQKQLLGERLYPLIQTMHAEWAGKITGMLLEIDNAELLHMLESHDALKVKVNEAIQVLQAHQAKQQLQQI